MALFSKYNTSENVLNGNHCYKTIILITSNLGLTNNTEYIIMANIEQC